MENNQQKETFSYTYSAKEQEELKAIREKYQPKEENKLDHIRRLDAGVTKKGTTAALVVGIIGALLMGLGMSLAMTELGELMGLHQDIALLVGVVIGVVGMAIVVAAYPLYLRIVKKEREKIAPEIMQLTDELMK